MDKQTAFLCLPWFLPTLCREQQLVHRPLIGLWMDCKVSLGCNWLEKGKERETPGEVYYI